MSKQAIMQLLTPGVAALFLASAVVMGQGDEPAGLHFWSRGQILQMSNALSTQVNATTKLAVKTIGTGDNQRFLLVHREGPGQSEYHATESDIMFVESGHATLIYGGKMVDPKETAPNELRGAGIQGGMERSLAPGDVITIPPKLPHQVKPRPGAVFNYFVVKVKAAD